MTISDSARKAGPFDGNDVATAFPFTFKVFAKTDIEVTYFDGTDESTLVLDSDYSVALNADQDADPGGTVTYPIIGSPLATGERLTVLGALTYEQPLDLQSLGRFDPQVLENELDRMTMLVLQLDELLNRAIKLPISNDVVDGTLPAGDAASTVIGFDTLGRLTRFAAQAGTSLIDLAASGGAALIGFIQDGEGTAARTVSSKLAERKSISDYTSLSAACSSLGGAEGTGYGTDPVELDLLGGEVSFTGTLYVPINVSFINGKITSAAGSLVFRNPYLADTGLRSYTAYWDYMKSVNSKVTFNCLTIINVYVGCRFRGCDFTDQYSKLVHVNSNALWTEYTSYEDGCKFSSNAALGAAILFDGNVSGTSVYSTGSGVGVADGSFGYTNFAPSCKIDSTAPAVGIKVADGATLYNTNFGFKGYARGAGPSGGFLYVDSATNVSTVSQSNFDVHLESFSAAANVLSISDNSRFWYNTGAINSASPEMVMAQGALADVRSNDITVIGVVLADSNGGTVFNGPSYVSKLVTDVSKRQWTEPACSVSPTNNQAITSNVTTKVVLDAEEYDTNSNFSASRFTPTVAGYYSVSAQVRIAATGTAQSASALLYKNGASYRAAEYGAVAANMCRSVNSLVYMNGSTDYLEVYAYCFDNAASPAVVSGSANTFFTACLLKKA